ncbi:hypothetical protein [Microbispora rosea]|uniref:hypothetical protein n=1 Tax=Microbispora rosea TaxID=58117 RepID=UPI0037B4F843
MARAKTPSRSSSAEKAVGRLFLAATLSWIAYVLLHRFTVAPDALACWLSGAVAGLALTVRAGRR